MTKVTAKQGVCRFFRNSAGIIKATIYEIINGQLSQEVRYSGIPDKVALLPVLEKVVVQNSEVLGVARVCKFNSVSPDINYVLSVGETYQGEFPVYVRKANEQSQQLLEQNMEVFNIKDIQKMVNSSAIPAAPTAPTAAPKAPTAPTATVPSAPAAPSAPKAAKGQKGKIPA
jgi:hypothetical protein